MDKNWLPKISVITVVYNAQQIIAQTIDSVLSQQYPNLEYIIIDGASSDKTLEIIYTYGSKISRVLSEKDSGIYDAMNKGLLLATGEYVIFMNAGDLFYNDTVLTAATATQADADFYYGNTAIIDDHGTILGDRRLSPPKTLTWKSLQMGMCVSHQSMLVRRAICEPFDLNYKISSDIDWTIKALKKSKHIVNTEIYFSKFLQGGTSSKRRWKGLMERFYIQVKHYGLWTTVLNHVRIAIRFLAHLAVGKRMN